MERSQHLIKSRIYQRAFSNILGAEFARWWRTSTWWIQTLIWVAVINGLLLIVLLSGIQVDTSLRDHVDLFSIFMGIFPAVGIMVLMQGAIVGEKRSGTASWVLSKPLSRDAFLGAKLIVNSVGAITTMVLIPCIIAYVEVGLLGRGAAWLPVNGFLAAVGLFILSLLFWLALTLMLGTFFRHFAPVIGIPIALLFGLNFLVSSFPILAEIFPYSMVVQTWDDAPALCVSLMLGEPLKTVQPLIVTPMLTIVFILVALWRFRREEF